ncbi:MAG: hypothetical protein BWY91_02932 [bacterium ADurb.BinA028]|nr:MAG: hypothetical protein BWY91_02932 [bacterium ADurb.BinA028]
MSEPLPLARESVGPDDAAGTPARKARIASPV